MNRMTYLTGLINDGKEHVTKYVKSLGSMRSLKDLDED